LKAFLYALGPATWGTTYIVTTELLPPDRPLLAGLLRALPAALVLLAIGRRLPRGAWWWRAGVLGTLNIGAFFALLFLSAERLPGGLAATVGAIGPILVALLAWPLLREAPGVWRVGAAVAGAVGVALLVLRSDATLDGLGLVAAFGGTASMSVGTVLTKRWGRPVDLFSFTAWQLLAGSLVLLPLLLAIEGLPDHLSARNVAGFAYLTTFGTAIAYALWFRGLDRMPASAASLLPLLSPVVAMAIGVLVQGEALGALQALGAALVLAAVIVGQRPPRRSAAQPVAASSATSSALSSPR
jgi:probable blue pigment (indigoidine) exporter